MEETIGDGAGVNCPWCGEYLQYCSDPLGDGQTLEDECSKCGKKFIWQENITTYFIAKRMEVKSGDDADDGIPPKDKSLGILPTIL